MENLSVRLAGMNSSDRLQMPIGAGSVKELLLQAELLFGLLPGTIVAVSWDDDDDQDQIHKDRDVQRLQRNDCLLFTTSDPSTNSSCWEEAWEKAGSKAEMERAAMSSVLRNLLEPVIEIEAHKITRVNPRTVAVFGYPADELIGSDVTMLMTEFDAAHHQEFVDRYESTGEAHVIGQPRDVQGKHRDGHILPLRLSVTPGATPGTYIGILHDQSQRDAAIIAQMERTKCALHVLGPVGASMDMGIRHEIFQTQAWRPGWQQTTGHEALVLERGPLVLAAYSDNGYDFKAFKLKQGVCSEKEARIKCGSHPFVKLSGERFLRISTVSCKFGSASGHPFLANEKPALYAGEIEFNDAQQIVRWSNLSGTYQCDPNHAHQTGLAIEKFWSLEQQAPAVVCGATALCISDGQWLVKVFKHSEEQFDSAQKKWTELTQGYLSENESARACHDSLKSMIAERCVAVDKYGYHSIADVPHI